VRRTAGLSVLEVLVAVALLSALVLPAFELFSVQRHQVAAAQRKLLLHGFALERLDEEESRLNALGFSGPRTLSEVVRPPGESLSVAATLSVSAVPSCTGLWLVTVGLTCADESTRGVARTVAVSRLVVDRDCATRLPEAWR
jgi:hypothetical protein